MSDDYAKEFRNTRAGNTDLQKLIEKKITDRMLAGEMTPQESGSKKAGIVIDQIEESVNKKYAKKKYGGKVQKMANGGVVRGYEGGGEVCRGMGRAYQGKSKKVQVR